MAMLRPAARLLLGAFLIYAGMGHLTFARAEFQAQVPSWMPLDPDLVVLASGVVEIVLGLLLAVAPRAWRPAVGWVTAVFFVLVFPGNVAQWWEGRDGFGLDTDEARFIRLLLQPVLIVWALWCTGAWAERRRRRASVHRHSGGESG